MAFLTFSYELMNFNTMLEDNKRKLKYLVHNNFDPFPNDEITEIYIILFVAKEQDDNIYNGMTGWIFKQELKKRASNIKFNRQFKLLADLTCTNI